MKNQGLLSFARLNVLLVQTVLLIKSVASRSLRELKPRTFILFLSYKHGTNMVFSIGVIFVKARKFCSTTARYCLKKFKLDIFHCTIIPLCFGKKSKCTKLKMFHCDVSIRFLHKGCHAAL